MTETNTIDELAACYKSNKLSLVIMDANVTLDDESLKDIQLSYKNAEYADLITVTVFDEYEDTKIKNPVLWLHLIIDTCEGFEEAIDYREWLLYEGYKNTPFFQSLYARYSEVIPKVRALVGNKVKAVDAHHIEFNTSIAKALRNYQL